jgi:hypothetical protein
MGNNAKQYAFINGFGNSAPNLKISAYESWAALSRLLLKL